MITYADSAMEAMGVYTCRRPGQDVHILPNILEDLTCHVLQGRCSTTSFVPATILTMWSADVSIYEHLHFYKITMRGTFSLQSGISVDLIRIWSCYYIRGNRREETWPRPACTFTCILVTPETYLGMFILFSLYNFGSWHLWFWFMWSRFDSWLDWQINLFT